MQGVESSAMAQTTKPSDGSEHCDVLVIGGGPAGFDRCHAAGRARAQGRHAGEGPHPRFHIGESLLPQNLALFERLGLRTKYPHRRLQAGREFVSDEHGGKSVAFRFADRHRAGVTPTASTSAAPSWTSAVRNSSGAAVEAHESTRCRVSLSS